LYSTSGLITLKLCRNAALDAGGLYSLALGIQMTSSIETAEPAPLDKIEEELLALPRAVREHLVQVLSSSLQDKDIAQLWDEEADRRHRAFVSGELTAIPAKEAIAEIRARLRK
jgi:hypothetical protein